MDYAIISNSLTRAVSLQEPAPALSQPSSDHQHRSKVLISFWGGSPQTHGHLDPCLLLNVILRLTKNSGHSVQIETLWWEAGSTMVKSGKFSLIGHRANFLTPDGNGARKFGANTWQVFLPNTHNLTWPRTRKHHMNPLEGHATEWLDCTLQKRPWKAKTSGETVLD